jgi:hypothetical protein
MSAAVIALVNAQASRKPAGTPASAARPTAAVAAKPAARPAVTAAKSAVVAAKPTASQSTSTKPAIAAAKPVAAVKVVAATTKITTARTPVVAVAKTEAVPPTIEELAAGARMAAAMAEMLAPPPEPPLVDALVDALTSAPTDKLAPSKDATDVDDSAGANTNDEPDETDAIDDLDDLSDEDQIEDTSSVIAKAIAAATKAAKAEAAAAAAAAAAARAAAAKSAPAPKKAPAKTVKTDPPKRGPGRPPSKPSPPPLDKVGIADNPKDADNRFEFVIGEPMMFKVLFTFFKNIKAREIHLRCSPTGLTFFTKDHSKMSRVVAHIDGNQVNWHYCESEFWLGINREAVESMFGSIDKSFYKLTIFQRSDDDHCLNFVLKDALLDKEVIYRFVLPTYAKDAELYEAENLLTPEAILANFPVEFTLTAKQFKKTVVDVEKYCDNLTFEKIGSHPLQLVFAKSGLNYTEVYRTADKIKLRSDVPPDGTFRATIKLANVKPLASSMVTDDVRILCREDSDMLFRSAIDAKALVVSTLTRLQ